MCRYAAPYKTHNACFDCRKSFKNRFDHAPTKDRTRQGPSLCPQCRKAMVNLGPDFKAPKMSDVKQWQKVELLFEHGFAYFSCGCCGPGYRPGELKEVAQFVEGARNKSEGEVLLAAIKERYLSKRSS